MLEFVDSDLYFIQDKNNFINPSLQVGSGSVEKSTGFGSGGQKITGSGSSSLLISYNVLLSSADFLCIFVIITILKH